MIFSIVVRSAAVKSTLNFVDIFVQAHVYASTVWLLMAISTFNIILFDTYFVLHLK